MSPAIYITHFENPHCFYFKFDEDLHDAGLQSLEDDITKYARCKLNDNAATAPAKCEIRDTVAAFEASWGKWVRAEIRNNLTSLECYQLWAVDHGKAFRTAYKNVVPLPPDLSDRKVKGARQGSIYGVLPAKLTFNLDSCASEIQPVAAWSAKAIEQCRKLFSDDNAVRVCYDIKQQHHEYLFGDLYIHVLPKNSPQTRSVHIGQALTSIKQAVEVDFKKEMDRIVFEYTTDRDAKPNQIEKNLSNSNGREIFNGTQNNNKPLTPLTPRRAPSTVIMSEIDGGVTRMKMRNTAPSLVASTTIQSEIDGGITRMHITRNFAPSEVSSTASPSEIDEGVKRTQNMNKPQTPQPMTNGHNRNEPNRRNARAHMPAGYEREIDNFDKYNK